MLKPGYMVKVSRGIAALCLGLSCSAASWAASHALIMTIDDYDNAAFKVPEGAPPSQSPDLPGVAKDAASFRRIAELMGVPAGNIRELRNAQLSAAGIRAAMQETIGRVQSGDKVLIFYAGHGSQRTGQGGNRCMEGMLTYDAQLYPDTPEGREQILKDYMRIIAEINAGLDDWFAVKPKAGVQVQRVPEFSEKTAPGAYYQPPSLDGARPGTFYANLRNVEEITKFGMRTLAYHEAVPGHHFQIAIAQELEGLPMFRKLIPFTAYAEGWALSCNPADLSWILPHVPTVRVCAWAKTFHQIRPLCSVQYAWEPVLVHGGRQLKHRKPMVRDWMACARSMRKGVIGAKPAEFHVWMLDLLGFDPSQDTIDDLFPGSHGLKKVLETYEMV